MRNPLADKVVDIKPSGIRKFFDIVSEMQDAISLGVGEPDFDTPWHIRDEGIYSLEKGRTFYTSNAGLKDLRQEICNTIRRKQGVSYDWQHEVLVTVGGSEAIDIGLRAMCNPGDEVLIPQPSYVSYMPCVVLADAVMSFFGSMGNDGAFNPWTTDISSAGNRGKVGGALAVMPVFATIFGAIVSGVIIDALDFFAFFTIMGGLVIAVGVLCLFTLRDAPGLAPNRDPRGFWHQFAAVFDYKIVGRNRELFWVFLVMMVYFIGFNVYFPYITVYFTDNLGMDYTLTGVVQGAGLLAASVLTIPAARFIDRGKCGPVIAAAVGCNLLGLLGVSFSTAFVPLLIGVFGAGAGYILVLQALTAWIKNLYPEDQRGQFEGVKQLFFVCVPMIVGPAIATPVINAFGVEKIVNGVAGMVPGNSLFLISGLVTLLALLPLFPAARMEKARAGAAAQP